MQEYIPPLQNCAHCGDALKSQRTGRPGEYCGTPCRQAAWRQRRREGAVNATDVLDAELTAWAAQMEADVERLINALTNPVCPGEEPLAALVRIQHHVTTVAFYSG